MAWEDEDIGADIPDGRLKRWFKEHFSRSNHLDSIENKLDDLIGKLSSLETHFEDMKYMLRRENFKPDVTRHISIILEQKLTADDLDVDECGGVRSVAAMCQFMEHQIGRRVLEKIESHNPDLAAAIREEMFVFEDILLIDDKGIADILVRLDRKVLAYALKGAFAEVQAQIFRNMSSRAVEMLKQVMEDLGAVKVKEVKNARQFIIEVVRQLEDEGIITIGDPDEGDE